MNPSFVRPLPILPPLSTCTLCSLHGVAQSVGISLHHLPFSLPPSPTTPILLVIGQNPGIHEDRASTPFLGKSGHILQFAYIRAHGLHELASIYVTNICRCYHRDGEGPTNSHYRACRPHLLTDLHHLLDGRGRSLTLLTLGAPATTHTYALLGRPRVTLTSSFSHQGATLPCPAPSSNPSSPATAAASSSPWTPAPLTSSTDPPPTQTTTPGSYAPAAPSPSPTTSPSSATKKRTKTKTPTTTPTTTSATIPTAGPKPNDPQSFVTVFSSFHPAAVDRSNNLIHAVSGHLTLLRAHLTGRMPVPSTPLILSPKGPPHDHTPLSPPHPQPAPP